MHVTDGSQPRASFTGIPSELRLLVYERIGSGRVHAEFDIGPETVYGVRPDANTRAFAALMRTCRLIRGEAEGILYKNDEPASIGIFDTSVTQKNALYWRSLSPFGFEYLRSLRRVELSFNIHAADMDSNVHVLLVMRLSQVLAVFEASRGLREFKFSLCTSKDPLERLQELRSELDASCKMNSPAASRVEQCSKAVNLDFAWKVARFLKCHIVKNDQFGRAKTDCTREMKEASWIHLLQTKDVADDSYSIAYIVGEE